MEKSELRKSIKPLLRDYPYSNAALKKALLNCREFMESKTVLSYKSLEDEINLDPILSEFKDKTILYPVISGDDLIFTKADEFIKNSYGILEPVSKHPTCYDKAVIFTPALLFDENRYRLGRGKGYYDRYLKENEKRLFSIGIGKEIQIIKSLPLDKDDQRLDLIIILSKEDENFFQIT